MSELDEIEGLTVSGAWFDDATDVVLALRAMAQRIRELEAEVEALKAAQLVPGEAADP